jgi:hypothetical protein
MLHGTAKDEIARIKAKVEAWGTHPMTVTCPELHEILGVMSTRLNVSLDVEPGEGPLDELTVRDYVVETIGFMKGALEAYRRCAEEQIRQWQEAARAAEEK